MNKVKINLPESADYEVDYFAWTVDQARKLRAARPSGLDWENVAEEIESLGRSDKRAIRSNLIIVLTHLLKWAYQPERRGSSWEDTLIEHRDRLQQLLSDSPSLRSLPSKDLKEVYKIARMRAGRQTKLPDHAFPAASPFTIDQILDLDFLPDAQGK